MDGTNQVAVKTRQEPDALCLNAARKVFEHAQRWRDGIAQWSDEDAAFTIMRELGLIDADWREMLK